MQYREFLAIYCDLDSILNTDQTVSEKVMKDDAILSNKFWSEMAEYEKNAPTVDIPQPKPEKDYLEVVCPAREPKKLSKFQIFTLVSSAAAILFFVLFVKFVPENKYSSEVATLIDQIDVEWGQDNINLKAGSRLWTNKGSMELRKGIIKVAYDEGVNVVIEGPAVFEIERTGVFMDYGRLYGTVSDAGLGFTVKTPTSQFVDHGTEFGIQADINGSSELHVIKGKVQVFTDSESKSRVGQMVLANHAVHYDSYSSEISDIVVKENAFVRQIDSKTNVVWRGEPLRLVSILSGGNGFDGGNAKTGIEPSTGEIYNVPRKTEATAVSEGYCLVDNRRFIDGVFVPNGKNGDNQVTSAGHTFGEFPETNGSYYTDITCYPYLYEIQGKKQEDTSKRIIQYKIKPVSKIPEIMDTPSILVHANAGVTFDLDEIRKANPGLTPGSFQSKCFPASMWKKRSEFWVLLDGECVFHCLSADARENINNQINIPIGLDNTYLTLATTDGHDGKSYDWCLFMEPVITLVKETEQYPVYIAD